MPTDLFKKGISLLLRRQTSILSAAFVIMGTVILSQILGLVRNRLLIAIFGASNTLGVYDVAGRLPDFIFQLVIGAALSSAFIPVFSDYLSKNEEKEAHTIASILLSIVMLIFFLFSVILFIFAPFFLQLFNLGGGYNAEQMMLMTNLMRVIIFGQFLFIFGMFLTALLQSYNHFFIPGLAAALYNLGIIIGILTLSSSIGIFAPAFGIVFGSLIFILVQIPLTKKMGYTFHLNFSFKHPGVQNIIHLMWPRTISIGIFYLGSLITISFISFLPDPGRKNIIFQLAQTLAFAPVALIGQAIAQAAFPILSREKNNIANFKLTFITSFNQMLYLILPVSVLILVLRIPIVRLIYGAPKLDWPATVLTGRVLAFFSFSIFAQALAALVYRAFYALHDTRVPLIVGSIGTGCMLILSYIFIIPYHFGIVSLAISYSLGSILQLIILLIILDRKVGGFYKIGEFISFIKFFFATFFTAFALYIPIKLLDQLVFDTTKTINLLILTGISSLAGLILYIFLTWLFNFKVETTYILMFKKIGNWREILGKSDEVIEGTKI